MQDNQVRMSDCLAFCDVKLIERLQNLLIAALNYLYNKFVKKIPYEYKNIIILGIFSGFFVYFLIFRSAYAYGTMLKHIGISQAVGSMLLVISALLSMKSEIRSIKLKKTISIPYFLFAIGLVVTGAIHPIGGGYFSLGIMMLFVYPSMYLVWINRGDYEVLFNIVAIACVITHVGYFFRYAALFLSDVDAAKGKRFEGGMYNANFLSFLGLALVCSSLYLMYYCFQHDIVGNIAVIVFCFIASAIGLIMITDGESRSALLIMIINLTCTAFFILKNELYKKNRNIFGNRTKLVVAIAGASLVIFALIFLGSHHFERFDIADKTPDQFFSGRLRLWSNYLSNLNILGHNMNNVDWNSLTAGINTRHAHNNFLEFSFRCGIPVGVASVAFQLSAGIHTLIIMFKRKASSTFELFVVIFTVHYTIHSLVDICTIPMGSYGAFFYYICIAPLLAKEEHCEK